MGTHQDASLDKHSRALSIVSGALISAAGFALLLAAAAWFMPRFLHFADSRWAGLLSVLAIIFVCLGGTLRRRRA